MVSSNGGTEERARELHRRAIIIDGRDPTFLLYRQTKEEKPQYWETIRQSGLTAIISDVPWVEDSFQEAAVNFGAWHERVAAHPETLIVRTAADIERAKAEGRTGFILSSQSPTPFEDDLRLVRVLYELGLRVMAMAYAKRNLLGDACNEINDGGLSKLGIEAIHEMNRLGIAIDLSHVSDQTMIQTIEESEQPVFFSHSNARSVVDHPRNVPDAYLRRLVEKGGICGISAYSDFLRPNGSAEGTTLDDYIKMTDYVVNLIGIDHVSLGFDVGEARTPAEVAIIGGGHASTRYVRELSTRANLFELTHGLLKHGYREEDAEKLLGRNLLGFFGRVWKG